MITNRGKFRRAGIEDYVKRMSEPREKPILDWRVRDILQRKLNLSGSFDPQSIYDPSQLYETLQRFGEPSNFRMDAEMEKAISKARAVFGFRNTHRKIQPDRCAYLTQLKNDKSAGIYLCSKAEALADAEHRSFLILRGKKSPNPCLAFARTQANNKTRLVWGYPLDMVILESRFGFQLISIFKLIRSPIVYSLRRLELGARLYASMRGNSIVGLDFSKFDSTVPAELIKVAFRILRTWFDFDGNDEVAWRTVVNYFVNTPIVMPDGCLYTGKQKGIPSGSLFTQLVGSIVNYILIQYACLKLGYFVPNGCVHVLGDDSVFSTNSLVDLDKMRGIFLKVGMVLNITKSDVCRFKQPFKFLGLVWKDGVAMFDDSRIWRSGVFPERWRKYPNDGLKAEVIAWRAIVVPLLSIGEEGAIILARRPNFVGPASMFSEDFSIDQADSMPGHLRYLMLYDDAKHSGLWNMAAFPFSA